MRWIEGGDGDSKMGREVGMMRERGERRDDKRERGGRGR